MPLITLSRIYDVQPPYASHTYLVDRLWPRGISKERLAGVIWLKEVAPSNALRTWYHKNLSEWTEFNHQYLTELENQNDWQPLLELIAQGTPVTLLYGSKNAEQNHAIILRDFLTDQLKQQQ